jgi:hypothetical protein
MSAELRRGQQVVLERLPESVRADDPEDDIFRRCLGRTLLVVSVEDNGDVELDVRGLGEKCVSIFVSADCVASG